MPIHGVMDSYKGVHFNDLREEAPASLAGQTHLSFLEECIDDLETPEKYGLVGWHQLRDYIVVCICAFDIGQREALARIMTTANPKTRAARAAFEQIDRGHEEIERAMNSEL